MNLIEYLFNYIAPHSCLGCQKQGYILCLNCAQQMSQLQTACFNCTRVAENGVCKPCSRTTGLHAVHIYGEYTGLIKDVIWKMKFDRGKAAAHDIAAALDKLFLPEWSGTDIVTYVPTATSRLRQRGYDHAALIAQEYAKRRDLPCQRLLGRMGQVRQVGASAYQRGHQLQQAFYVTKVKCVAKKNVLLVDDVLTTGATLKEAAACLCAAGADQVTALLLAKTSTKNHTTKR